MRKQCPYCQEYFKPKPKLKTRQKTCEKEACRKAHRKEYKKKWWEANKSIYKSRYKETKECPSRKPAARAAYLKQDHVKEKHAEQMQRWRKKKKLERGARVMCTDFDIELTPVNKQKIVTEGPVLSVMCTDTDILIRTVNKGKSGHKWNVMCTDIDRHSGKRMIS